MVAATALVSGWVAGSLVAFASPALAAGPSVTVHPPDGLSNGQSVTVTGSGFSPNTAQLIVVQCAAAQTGPSACDVGNVRFTRTGASGTFTTTLTVASRFGSIDCTRVACIVQAHEGINPSTGQTGTSAALAFGAAARPGGPAPSTSTAVPLPAVSVPAVSLPGVSTPPSAPAGRSSAVDAGATSRPAGPSAALPTAAATGRAVTGGVPLLSEIGAAAALALLLGTFAYRRRARRGH